MAQANSITHYPVDNGDMTLIQVGTKDKGKTILVDMNIRQITKDNEQDCFDIASDLYKQLPRDSKNRPYVDLFVLTHPDDDHCRSFQQYMYTGDPKEWKKPEKDDEQEKIIMREIWFSHICTTRVDENNKKSDDAKAFRTEAKRRRQLFEDKEDHTINGNRLKVIGYEEDDSEKALSWNLDGMVIQRIDTATVGNAKALILGPFDDDIFTEEQPKDKNGSSVIIRWTINGARVLLGGDAKAHVWKHVWEENENHTDRLKYDLLVAPHHCSWHTLSYDSESGENTPKVLSEAYDALSQAEAGAHIISSSRPFGDDTPPSKKAKKEYLKILDKDENRFICLSDRDDKKKPPQPVIYKLSSGGLNSGSKAAVAASITGSSSASGSYRHG